MKTKAYIRSALLSVPLVGLAAIAQAQGTCADLNILSVNYAPFSDTAIEVTASTDPGTFFSYPTFSLVSAEGETISWEAVNFFGITENPQRHYSPLVQGQSLPESPFTGTLLFIYYGADDMDTCAYPISASLCPPAPCSSLQVFLYNTGTPANASFNWSLTDADGLVVESGVFNLEAAAAQTAVDSLCLPPGAYTLSMEQVSGPANEYPFGITRDLFISNGPSSVVVQGQANELPFVFFEPCFEGTEGIAEQGLRAPIVSAADGMVTITTHDGSALGVVEVFDVAGRTVHRSRSNDQRTVIDLRSIAPAMYLLRTTDTATGTRSFTQRFLLN